MLLRHYGYLAPHLYLPFVNLVVELPWVVYMVFAAFVMVGTVNAVNITDGVDGLSSSVTLPGGLPGAGPTGRRSGVQLRGQHRRCPGDGGRLRRPGQARPR